MPVHANVVSVVGVVTSGRPVYLLVSYCDHGSLLSYLAKTKDQASLTSKLQMCLDIATGMDHLASNHFVHRDLAARNVLLDLDMVCKIADFGLSRAVNSSVGGAGEEYYRSMNGVFPVRWTAPEVRVASHSIPPHWRPSRFRLALHTYDAPPWSVRVVPDRLTKSRNIPARRPKNIPAPVRAQAMSDGVFNQASDVWSFGITCVEIFDDGNRPYSTVNNTSIADHVMGGNKHRRPDRCPARVYVPSNTSEIEGSPHGDGLSP